MRRVISDSHGACAPGFERAGLKSSLSSLASPINQILEDDGVTRRIKAQVPIGTADKLFLRLRVLQ